MTALVTVSDTACATAWVISWDAPTDEANAAARRRISPTLDGTAGSVQAAPDPVDARTAPDVSRESPAPDGAGDWGQALVDLHSVDAERLGDRLEERRATEGAVARAA